MSNHKSYDPRSPTPSMEAAGMQEQLALLPPPHPSASSAIQLHPSNQFRSSLQSPNMLEYAPLSPLIQRTPRSASSLITDTKFSHKVYQGFTSDDLFRDAEIEPRRSQNSQRASDLLQHDNQKWSDPEEALGSKSIWIVILTGLGLMGLFVLLGHPGNSVEHSNGKSTHPHATLSTHFPFSPSHYLEDCKLQATDIHAADPESEADVPLTLNTTIPIHIPYFSLTQAEQAVEDIQPYSKTDNQGRAICKKTLTYLLDDDFGMAFHLNAISLANALAKKDGRDFFIVDGDWDRGFWPDHFLEISAPACQPPPPAEMYGCPRSSRHWIITSSIFPYHFSDEEFQLAYGEDSAKDEHTVDFLPRLIPNKRKPIFEMARGSFETLFTLNAENRKLIEHTRKEIIDSKAWKGGHYGQLPPFVSVHIRKGDRHPFNPVHKLDYIPVSEYIDTINATWSHLRALNQRLPVYPNVYVASDTPLIMDALLDMVPDWSLFHLSQSTPKELSLIAHPHEYSQRHFHAHVKSERVSYTRGQVIDMHFLGGGWAARPTNGIGSISEADQPLATICTVSSNICQFAALQLGWHEAFEKGRFINIDLPLTRSWTGIEIPKAGSGDEADVHEGGMHHHRRRA